MSRDANPSLRLEPRPPGGQQPASWLTRGVRSRLEPFAAQRRARRSQIAMLLVSALLLSITTSATAQVFTVNTATDPGDGVCNAANCTLREAILAANDPGAFSPTIDFAIPGSGTHTIMPLIPLPTITRDMTIRGFTQPGAAAPPFNNPFNSTLRIQIDGSLIPDSGVVYGLHVNAPSFGDLDVSGIAFVNFARPQGDGIAIWAQLGRNITIASNHLGIAADGSVAMPNDIGVRNDSASGTRIEGNVISGNRVGVVATGRHAVGTTGMLLSGNRIGTNRTGTASMPNTEDGIRIVSGCASPAQAFTIRGNLISGNARDGIHLAGETAGCVQLTELAQIAGNRIGTNAAGNAPLSNGRHGIASLLVASPQSLIIGSPTNSTFPDDRNTIGFNLGAGIAILDGGSGAIMRENTYRANVGLPVDLGGDGPDANDLGDADTGPNRRMNSPTLLGRREVSGGTEIRYRVEAAAPNVRFPLRVDFYTLLDNVIVFRTTDFYDVAGATRSVVLTSVSDNMEVIATANDDSMGDGEGRPSHGSEFSGVAPRALFADGFE